MNNNIELSKSREIQQTSIAQEKVGQHICNKMNTLLAGAIALEKIATFASEHGNRSVCAGITLATGISCLAHGNLVVGGMATFAGLKETINIWQASNSKNEIVNLLNDAGAGVDMVKTLEEANRESFKNVETNLQIVKKNIIKMNDQMEKIKLISTEGQKDIEEVKEKLTEQYEEANNQFSAAKASFKLSQARYKQANTTFIRSLKKFNELFEIAQTADISDKEKLEKFIKVAKKIQNQCAAAQKAMQEGSKYMDEGLQSLDTAQDKEREAYANSILLMERAKNRMELINAQAKVKRQYEQKINEMEDELGLIQERNEEKKALLDEVSADIDSAKKAAEDKFGTLSVILGVVPGAIAGFQAGGAIGAIAGGYGGGTLVHNRKAVINKIDDCINGPLSFVDVNPNQEEQVKVKFASRSTGWFNRFIRKKTQSYTTGMVEIRIAKEIVSLPFNLNHDYKVNKSHLMDLQQLLGNKIKKGEISAQTCLNILSELETKFIDRGSNHQAQTGLISTDCHYFAELKRNCNARVKSENKGS